MKNKFNFTMVVSVLFLVVFFVNAPAYSNSSQNDEISKKAERCLKRFYKGKTIPFIGSIKPGRIDLLNKCSENLIKQYPNHVDALLTRAEYFNESQQYTLVLEIVDKALDAAKNDDEKTVLLLDMKSQAYFYLKKEKDSLKLLQQAKKLCKDCYYQQILDGHEKKLNYLIKVNKVLANRNNIKLGQSERAVVSKLGAPDKRVGRLRFGKKYQCLSWFLGYKESALFKNIENYYSVYLSNGTVIDTDASCATGF